VKGAWNMCETCVPSTQYSVLRPVTQHPVFGTASSVQCPRNPILIGCRRRHRIWIVRFDPTTNGESLNTPLTPTLVVLRRTWGWGQGQSPGCVPLTVGVSITFRRATTEMIICQGSRRLIIELNALPLPLPVGRGWHNPAGVEKVIKNAGQTIARKFAGPARCLCSWFESTAPPPNQQLLVVQHSSGQQTSSRSI